MFCVDREFRELSFPCTVLSSDVSTCVHIDCTDYCPVGMSDCENDLKITFTLDCMMQAINPSTGIH